MKDAVGEIERKGGVRAPALAMRLPLAEEVMGVKTGEAERVRARGINLEMEDIAVGRYYLYYYIAGALQ